MSENDVKEDRCVEGSIWIPAYMRSWRVSNEGKDRRVSTHLALVLYLLRFPSALFVRHPFHLLLLRERKPCRALSCQTYPIRKAL